MIFDQDKSKMELLNQAIKSGNLNQVRAILTHLEPGEVVNQMDKGLQTPIFYAGIYNDQQFGFKVTCLLLQKGANPFHKDTNKQTVLYYLAKLGKSKIVDKLMQFSFNLNDNDYIQQTPLFFAAVSNHLKIAETLILNGADVNHKDYNNQTCLFYAARQGYLQMCKLLANHGCNVLHHDHGKKTAVFFAKDKHHKQVVQYLNGFKNQAKRQKQEKKESSMNDKKAAKKKRQIQKYDYCLVYTNQQGQVHQLTPDQIKKFRQISQQNQKIYDLMKHPQKLQNQPQPQQKRFQKIANKIINYFWKLQNSTIFHRPVAQLNLQDYDSIIKHPMDFGTIKTKLAFNAYYDGQDFKNDMNLVFDNCLLYNGKQSHYGKIAFQMKLQFNAMYKKQISMI